MLRIGGASLDSVAEKFGVSRDAIHRHVGAHVEPEMRANYLAGPIALHQLAQRAADEGVSLLDYLNIIRSTLMRQFDVVASVGDHNGINMISGRLLETLREIGRLSGELTKAGGNIQINNNLLVLQSPLFAEAQSAVISALASFPEARVAVIRELRALEDRKKVESMQLIQHRPAEVEHV
jgi:hypothetical protein